jgi:ring-1,2-phenylacetyl-CoA epoxidase subunit PaaC
VTTRPSGSGAEGAEVHSAGADGAALTAYALALGDDALVLAQRCGQWITNAPQLEEDVALANIGLDLLGQARTLLTHAGEVEGKGRTEDDLAYLRDERAFTNVQLVELANGDFAVTMARLLAFSTYQLALYEELQRGTDPTLAAIAAKAVKEVAYHRDHATNWVLRLGDGTDLSHRRTQAGLERVWPYVGELFEASWIAPALIERRVAVDVRTLRSGWDAYMKDVLAEATLEVPDVPQRPAGGRRGIHTEAMGYLLAEMQHIHRSHPGARW